MKLDFLDYLKYDPIQFLWSSKDFAIDFHSRRDLLEDYKLETESLWELPEPAKIVKRQLPEGYWKFAAKDCTIFHGIDYAQIEIFRHLGILIEKYGFDNRHPAIQKAADYIFSCQTEEGDIRGSFGIHYSPDFTAMIMELLVKAGYGESDEVLAAFDWLESVRQFDGGWAWFLKSQGINYREAFKLNDPVMPNRSKPYSHCLTGLVLRAYSAHDRLRESETALLAANLVADRFFQKDKYSDRGKAEYWTSVTYPFWFTDIVTAMDSISKVGLPPDDPRIERALEFFRECQRPDGSFDFKLLRDGDKLLQHWICLAVCRIMKRMLG